MAVRCGEGILRPRATPALVELQLRARRAKHRVRRPERAGDGGQRRRRLLQGRPVVLDKQLPLGHHVRPRIRRHHPGDQRQRRVRR